jgi:hypothetical protein
MRYKTAFIVALLALPVASSVVSSKIAYKLGFGDGWTANDADGTAISWYHGEADALPDDSDKAALAKIWEDARANSNLAWAMWKTQPWYERVIHCPEPFWLSGNGEPRRLSWGSRAVMSKVLESYGTNATVITNTAP